MSRRILSYGALAVILIMVSWFLIWNHQYNNRWRASTTPLSSATVASLCSSFGLPDEDTLCSGKRPVYGPDFYEVIRDSLRPYEEYKIPAIEASTYAVVEDKLGAFRYECEPVARTGDGFEYFRCFYDLRGDREFPIVVSYSYPDMAVFRISTPMGHDD